MKTVSPQSRQENIIIQEFENETLIYDLLINKVFCLNQTSTRVWQLCDGRKSVAEITSIMSRELKVTVSEELVWLAIEQLQKNELLRQDEKLKVDFGGLNRRKVIREIGLMSMIALPMISAVVTATAVAAASACVALNVCFSDATKICQTCTGTIQVDLFLSNDGTCTGAGGSVPADCSSGAFNVGFDYKITSV